MDALIAAAKGAMDVIAEQEANPMNTWVDTSLLEVCPCARFNARPLPVADETVAHQEQRRPSCIVAMLLRAVEQQRSSDDAWPLQLGSQRPYSALASDIGDLTRVRFEKAVLPEHVRSPHLAFSDVPSLSDKRAVNQDDGNAYLLHPAGTLVGDGGYATDKALGAAKLGGVSLADMFAARDIVHDLLVTFHPFHQDLSGELQSWRPPFPMEFIIVEVRCWRRVCGWGSPWSHVDAFLVPVYHHATPRHA